MTQHAATLRSMDSASTSCIARDTPLARKFTVRAPTWIIWKHTTIAESFLEPASPLSQAFIFRSSEFDPRSTCTLDQAKPESQARSSESWFALSDGATRNETSAMRWRARECERRLWFRQGCRLARQTPRWAVLSRLLRSGN